MTIKHIEQTRLILDKEPNQMMYVLNNTIHDMQERGWEVEFHFNVDGDLGYAVLVEGFTWIDSEDDTKNNYLNMDW